MSINVLQIYLSEVDKETMHPGKDFASRLHYYNEELFRVCEDTKHMMDEKRQERDMWHSKTKRWKERWLKNSIQKK